uniref:Putative secreted peptide n=1 Tax=Anopheles braziliensis TaxID=58242 RepID=A0A2M3ZX45_9DIPT
MFPLFLFVLFFVSSNQTQNQSKTFSICYPCYTFQFYFLSLFLFLCSTLFLPKQFSWLRFVGQEPVSVVLFLFLFLP